MKRSRKGWLMAAVLSAAGLIVAATADGAAGAGASGANTNTPIQHLVVIFQENVSFDHYFGTYPNAANPKGEPAFQAKANTPTVNGLSDVLLASNPNLGNPQRLDRSQALICDQDHGYTSEQKAFDAGAMDKFAEDTGRSLTLAQCLAAEGNPAPAGGTNPNYAVMDYFDGNTVTALWNYAQNFAMSDNSYSTTFGPSTPGAINVVSGNTFGATCGPASSVFASSPCPAGAGAAGPAVAQGGGTTYSDSDPFYDGCSAGSTIGMGGQNIGDLLNARGITWGWFQGGFAPSSRTSSGAPVCGTSHTNIGGATIKDYSAHHEPFEYYPQTANPNHLPPTSMAAIGHSDQANHQYDLSNFWQAADAGNMPAVSYLKAPEYQDGHAGYSDPIDEQTFLVNTINHLQSLPTWSSTAVVIAYDDSDGWYDSQMGPIVNQSQTALDALTGTGQCGANPARVPSGQQARCGLGMRQPLLVISPWTRANTVDHSVTDLSSVVRFIEDNWGVGRIGSGSFDALAGSLGGLLNFNSPKAGKLFLNPITGQPTGQQNQQGQQGQP